MRRNACPHHFARKAEFVEEFGLVVRDARGQGSPIPKRRRGSHSPVAAGRFGEAVGAVQLRSGRDVLPAMQEGVEMGGGDGLDLAAQTAQGGAVNAGEDAAIAPFDFAAACHSMAAVEVAAEDLAFALQVGRARCRCLRG